MFNTEYLPVWPVNEPGGGYQIIGMIVPEDVPVYSCYTGELIGYGPIKFGVPCDAPEYHPNYGMDYHAITYNHVNNTYMAHDREATKIFRNGSKNTYTQRDSNSRPIYKSSRMN